MFLPTGYFGSQMDSIGIELPLSISANANFLRIFARRLSSRYQGIHLKYVTPCCGHAAMFLIENLLRPNMRQLGNTPEHVQILPDRSFANHHSTLPKQISTDMASCNTRLLIRFKCSAALQALSRLSALSIIVPP